jgi:hypothetical protein
MVGGSGLDFDIFEALIQFHVDNNLAMCRKYIVDGANTDPYGRQIIEGLTEIDYKGFLIIADGQRLIDEMRKDVVVKDKNISPIATIPDAESFLSLLGSQLSPDGAYLVDRENALMFKGLKFTNELEELIDMKDRILLSRITELTEEKSELDSQATVDNNVRLCTLDALIKDLERSRPLRMTEMLPYNFVFLDGDYVSGPVLGNRHEREMLGIQGHYEPHQRLTEDLYRFVLGLKTKLGLAITQIYPHIDAYQIKRTAFGPFNFGTVLRIDRDGLAERFYCMHDPSAGVYVNEEYKIAGIYEHFRRKNSSLVVMSRALVDVHEGKVRYHQKQDFDVPDKGRSCADTH